MPDKTKLLLVDDLKENLLALEALLRSNDVEIFQARSATAALDLMLDHDFALALIDVQMPQVSGFELAQWMRGPIRTKSIPIIFVTAANLGPDATFDGYDAGAVDFLLKPINPLIVKSKVRVFLELDRQKKQLKAQVDELFNQQQWLETLLDSIPTPVMLFDAKTGALTLSNKAAEESEFSFPKEPDRFPENLYYYTDSTGNKLLRKDWVRFRTMRGEEVQAEQLTWHTPDKKIALLVHSKKLPAMHGHPGTALIAFQDITTLKAAEEEAHNAKDLAEAANQSKSAFLANMSHEIRTPLGAILGFTELLRDQNLSGNDRSKYVQIIHRNGQLLGKLIDDILDLSKVEAGKIEVENIRFSIADLLGEITSTLKLKAQEKSLCFEIKAKGKIPELIVSDPTRIKQILINVVGNAIKFTHQGEVKIVVSCVPNSADACADLTFLISDTGPGIEQEKSQRIFEPFTQADSSTTRNFGGTGLGLILSRRLANALEGDVILKETSPGKGSSFLVTIKVKEAGALREFEIPNNDIREAETFAATIETQTTELKSLKILLVEDSLDNQFLIRRLLKKKGADIETASNGIEGTEKALSGDFDIVLMDIQMPVADGYEATRTLRKAGFKKPIVALSAHAMKEDREKSLAVGCNEHLTKPINLNTLVQTIKSLTSATGLN